MPTDPDIDVFIQQFAAAIQSKMPVLLFGGYAAGKRTLVESSLPSNFQLISLGVPKFQNSGASEQLFRVEWSSKLGITPRKEDVGFANLVIKEVKKATILCVSGMEEGLNNTHPLSEQLREFQKTLLTDTSSEHVRTVFCYDCPPECCGVLGVPDPYGWARARLIDISRVTKGDLWKLKEDEFTELTSQTSGLRSLFRLLAPVVASQGSSILKRPKPLFLEGGVLHEWAKSMVSAYKLLSPNAQTTVASALSIMNDHPAPELEINRFFARWFGTVSSGTRPPQIPPILRRWAASPNSGFLSCL